MVVSQQKLRSLRLTRHIPTVFLLALVQLLLTTCGSLADIPASQATPITAFTDRRMEVCALIKVEEISNIVGEDVERTNAGGCSFSLPFKDKPINQILRVVDINLLQFKDHQIASTIFATKERFPVPAGKTQSINGFGDKAFTSSKSLSILKDDFILEISLDKDMTDEQRQKKLEALAKLLLERINNLK